MPVASPLGHNCKGLSSQQRRAWAGSPSTRAHQLRVRMVLPNLPVGTPKMHGTGHDPSRNDSPRMMKKALAPPAVTGILLCVLLSATARSELASIQPVGTQSQRKLQQPPNEMLRRRAHVRGRCMGIPGVPACAAGLSQLVLCAEWASSGVCISDRTEGCTRCCGADTRSTSRPRAQRVECNQQVNSTSWTHAGCMTLSMPRLECRRLNGNIDNIDSWERHGNAFLSTTCCRPPLQTRSWLSMHTDSTTTRMLFIHTVRCATWA